MLTKHSNLYVCTDCYVQHETGVNENPDSRWSEEAFAAGVADLESNGLQIVSGDSEKEMEFSSSRCGLCGTTLGGSRHHLVLLQEVDIEPLTREDHAMVLGGYIEAALWSSTDDDGEPLDGEHDADDLTDAARAQMSDDVTHFLAEVIAAHDPAVIVEAMSLEQLGHDFWLTRNRHGAGFWDRGLGTLGDDLTKLAHAAGSCDLTLDADGKVHAN